MQDLKIFILHFPKFKDSSKPLRHKIEYQNGEYSVEEGRLIDNSTTFCLLSTVATCLVVGTYIYKTYKMSSSDKPSKMPLITYVIGNFIMLPNKKGLNKMTIDKPLFLLVWITGCSTTKYKIQNTYANMCDLTRKKLGQIWPQVNKFSFE